MKFDKKIKNYFPKQAMLLTALAASAISADAEFRWGPMVGINGSSFFWKQDLVDTRYGVGPTAGLTGELMIPGIGFGIGVGLNYQMNCAKVDFGQREVWAADGIGRPTVKLHTLQVPLNLRFKWTRMEGVEQYVAPLVYAGPVFTFNLAADNATMIKHPAGTVDIQVGAGVELFERWQLTGGYYWGVSYQIRTIKLDNFSARPQGWFINAAWLF